MIMRCALALSAWLIPTWIALAIAQQSTPGAPAPPPVLPGTPAPAPVAPSIIWTYGPNPDGVGGQIAIPTNPTTGVIDPTWGATNLSGYYYPGMTLQNYQNSYNQLKGAGNGTDGLNAR
jgi:hypothetical protein